MRVFRMDYDKNQKPMFIEEYGCNEPKAYDLRNNILGIHIEIIMNNYKYDTMVLYCERDNATNEELLRALIDFRKLLENYLTTKAPISITLGSKAMLIIPKLNKFITDYINENNN